jgi:hypothetical protein
VLRFSPGKLGHRMNRAGVVLTSVPAVVGELAFDLSDPRTPKAFGVL